MAKSKTLQLILDAKNKTSKAFNNVNKNVTKLEKNAARLKAIGNVFGGFVAGASVIASFRAVIDATKEQEAVLAQVQARLESTGGASGKTTDELIELAASLQKVTTFGDEAILKMQGLLLTFTNIKGDTFNDATTAILDMSVAMGQDLKTSALQLGKALNDPIKGITALTRVGVAFTDQQKEQITVLTESGEVAKAQAIILRELQTEFGGAAAAAADTFGGALEQLSNAFGDLLEADGQGLTGAKEEIQSLTALLQDPATVAAMSTFTTAIVNIASTMVGAISDIASFTKAMNDLMSEFEIFGTVADTVSDAFIKLIPGGDAINAYLDYSAAQDKVTEAAAKELEELAKLNEQTNTNTESMESFIESLKSVGVEAANSRDILAEFGGVQIDDNISKSVKDIVKSLEEERRVLSLTAKEQFIYNQTKKAGVDATYEEINAIKNAAGSLFDKKESLRATKTETNKLSDATKEYKKAAGSLSTDEGASSTFGKATKEAEELTAETEKATKAKKEWFSSSAGEGVDPNATVGPLNLTPEMAEEKAQEIITAMQNKFNANPVQVKVNVPTANQVLSPSTTTEPQSAATTFNPSFTALKEGTK